MLNSVPKDFERGQGWSYGAENSLRRPSSLGFWFKSLPDAITVSYILRDAIAYAIVCQGKYLVPHKQDSAKRNFTCLK